MGIARLSARLKEAGISKIETVGREGEQQTLTAIIDGPNFAHFIFRRCEDRISRTEIGLNVTYAECTTEAIDWLRQLEHFGFRMCAFILHTFVLRWVEPC